MQNTSKKIIETSQNKQQTATNVKTHAKIIQANYKEWQSNDKITKTSQKYTKIATSIQQHAKHRQNIQKWQNMTKTHIINNNSYSKNTKTLQNIFKQ